MSLLGLVLLASLSAASPIACTQRWQCAAHNDYNWADCINGFCACLIDQGFRGQPDTGCYCPNQNQIQWVGSPSKPYCLDVAEGAKHQANAEIRISQAMQVYINLIYPTPLFILNKTKDLSSLFAPGVRGRIDPFGIFEGDTLHDYFYVFSSTPGSGVADVFFKELSYNASDQTVMIRVDIQFAQILPNGTLVPRPFKITQSGLYRFNPNHTIASVDAIIHNVGVISNPGVVPTGIIYGGDRSAFVNNLCTDILNFCPPTMDPSGYYSSQSDCVSFMTGGSVRVATYDSPAGNTDICRRFHASIARHFPEIHCPHAGKTGGGQCVDPPYYTTYSGPNQQF